MILYSLNIQGQETNRIESNTVFKTYVEDGNVDLSRTYLNYAEAEMPNVMQTRVGNGDKLKMLQVQSIKQMIIKSQLVHI